MEAGLQVHLGLGCAAAQALLKLAPGAHRCLMKDGPGTTLHEVMWVVGRQGKSLVSAKLQVPSLAAPGTQFCIVVRAPASCMKACMVWYGYWGKLGDAGVAGSLFRAPVNNHHLGGHGL